MRRNALEDGVDGVVRQEIAGRRPHRARIESGDRVVSSGRRAGLVRGRIVEQRRGAREALQVVPLPRRVVIEDDALDAGGR